MPTQTEQIVVELKAVLRAQKLTYADVARHLEISEASVKRLFSKGQISLDRLEQICDLAGLRLPELVARIDEQPARVTQLGLEQEKQLLADEKLLLVTFMVLNGWSIERIVSVFRIDSFEVTRKLAQLDRMGFIDLLPDNRIRRRIARNFSWKKNGPVQRYFESDIKRDFLASRFAKVTEHLRFVGGLISKDSVLRLHKRIDQLCDELDDCIQADSDLPVAEKMGVGGVFALRPWELPAFTRLRRE